MNTNLGNPFEGYNIKLKSPQFSSNNNEYDPNYPKITFEHKELRANKRKGIHPKYETKRPKYSLKNPDPLTKSYYDNLSQKFYARMVRRKYNKETQRQMDKLFSGDHDKNLRIELRRYLNKKQQTNKGGENSEFLNRMVTYLKRGSSSDNK